MSERTLTPDALTALTDDIAAHGFAVLQTRAERVPFRYRSPKCSEPDGCHRSTTLVTLALAAVNDEGDQAAGLTFARDGIGDIVRISTCDEHRIQASHDLYFTLTGRERPDGIRAFDLPGQHMSWT
ncbi:hypothetical protein ABZ341_36215 [Streptomyces sp. NPDC006173]|uniref:hypothetical protein n=1 Tax=Streptomyces sp. NPDC006173 TaxID=3155349 RepID=UPI0034089A17